MRKLLSYFRLWIGGGELPPGTKIFIIGRNKTGTTSVAKALADMGFKVARQRPAELLLEDWHNGDFSRIIQFCQDSGAQVFGDIPFSLPGTYEALDRAFPGSKFILTMRDSPEQWYHSLKSFHTKLFGKEGKLGREELMAADYVYKGWLWQVNQWVYRTPEEDPYDMNILTDHYIRYNESVMHYYRHRKKDLLVLNPAGMNANERLARFLGIRHTVKKELPWIHRTDQIEKPYTKNTHR